VQFDNVRGLTAYDLDRQVDWVLNLVRAGFIERILLSHDVCLRSHLGIAGGAGFTLILREFLPRLQAAGLSADELVVLTVDNPRRALTGER
jgi:predicted metal-dependent phosphotriesterase family hydrolase